MATVWEQTGKYQVSVAGKYIPKYGSLSLQMWCIFKIKLLANFPSISAVCEHNFFSPGAGSCCVEPACCTFFPHGTQSPPDKHHSPFLPSGQGLQAAQVLQAIPLGPGRSRKHQPSTAHHPLSWEDCLLRQPATITSSSWEVFCLYKSNAKPTTRLGIQLAPCPGDQICWQIQVAALGEHVPQLL